MVDFSDSSKAIYLQIADRIADDVLRGVYKPDCRIPSVREYAAEVQVNANTVMRAYDYLSQQGVIYNKRGVGYFIAPGAPDYVRHARIDTIMNTEMVRFFDGISTLGVTPEELREYYETYLEKAK